MYVVSKSVSKLKQLKNVRSLTAFLSYCVPGCGVRIVLVKFSDREFQTFQSKLVVSSIGTLIMITTSLMSFNALFIAS